MRVNLVDPKLCDVAGHFLDHDLRIAGALAALGHDVTVIGCHGADARIPALMPSGVKFLGIFPDPAAVDHIWPIRHSGRQLIVHRLWAHRLGRDLRALPAADRWVWPTLEPSDMAAIAFARPAATVSGVLHRRPGRAQGSRYLAWLAWRDGGRLLLRRSVTLGSIGTLDDGLTAELAALLSPVPVTTLPRPQDASLPLRRRSSLGTVGVFGAQRPERGLALLDPLVRACTAAGLDVIVQDSHPLSERTADLAGVRRFGFVDDIASLMDEADLVVLPYNAASYVNRYSGVCGQAIACGVPVLAPAGSSAARLLASFGTGSFFDELSAAAIASRILQIRDDYTGLSASAFAAAGRWSERNGVARHAAALMGEG